MNIMKAFGLALALAFVFSTGDADAKGRAKGKKKSGMAGVCKTDHETYCKDVSKGGGRLLCCMKQNEASLSSSTCKDGIAKNKKYAALDAATCTTTGTNTGWSLTEDASGTTTTTTTE